MGRGNPWYFPPGSQAVGQHQSSWDDYPYKVDGFISRFHLGVKTPPKDLKFSLFDFFEAAFKAMWSTSVPKRPNHHVISLQAWKVGPIRETDHHPQCVAKVWRHPSRRPKDPQVS